MATFVTATKIEASSGTNANGSVSSTAGNALFALGGSYIANGNGSTGGPTITGGGTWTKNKSGANVAAAALHIAGSISSCPSATGGAQTINADDSQANGLTCVIQEFSGMAASVFEQAPAVATGNSGTATTSSVTNTQATAVFVALVADTDGSVTSTVTGTSTGWNYNPNSTDETNGNTNFVLGTGYKIVSVAASESSSWTITSSQWLAIIAVYKQSAAAYDGSKYPWSQTSQRYPEKLQMVPY